jgi:hypothetical protein|tara:strand:- start:1962 stop:2414 length:453 start_codon:yes stop_codon:yes gene_type:complete
MSWVTEMRKGLDQMWKGLGRDKMRQEGYLSDIAPKWWSVFIWIIVALLFCGSSLQGQGLARPELVPYQIVPIDLQPGDCNLEVGIQLVHPYNVENMQEPQQQETLELIYQRIGYEVVNPQMSAGLFEIDGKLYHLIRIPYTGASTEWDWN